MIKRTALSRVREHAFALRALKDAVTVHASLEDKTPSKITPSYSRDPDEHEFFRLSVGQAMAELLTWCEHLEHLPLYISNYHETTAMKKAGINRHKSIVYHIESYIVRVQSLFDRILRLVDAVFHLLNAPKNCRASVVLTNLKVKRTKVPATVKRLEKLLEQYKPYRNEVIHHQSFKEDQLRVLEMYYVLEEIQKIDKAEKSWPANISELKKELTAEVVKTKKKEFAEFNEKLGKEITDILSVLEPHYEKEYRSLHIRISGSVSTT